MRLAIGLVLLLAGAVWLAQGLDLAFAPQSFMTGSPTWIVLGAIAAIAGIVLIWRSARRVK